MEEVEKRLKEDNLEKEIEKRKSKLNKFFFGWIKDNYDKVFLALLILAFIIRIWIFFKTMDQTVWWDGADYLSTAKKWGLGLDIKDIWYYRRGFLFPLIGALFFKLGLGEVGLRFLMVLFSTGIIVVSYFIISKMFNKKLALLAVFALNVSWIILFFTGRILTDIPSSFFLLLSVLLFWKGYVLKEGNKFMYLFGLVFALAVLTRMQSLALVPPFLIFIFIKEKFKALKNKQLWITLGIFLLVLLPHIIIYSVHYGNPVTDIASYYLKIGEDAPAQKSIAIFQYFKDLPYMMSTPMFIMLLIGIVYFFIELFLGLDKVSKSSSLQSKLFVLLWIISLFLLIGYITAHSYVEQRYITSGLPFLFLIAVSPLIFIEEMITKYLHNKKISLFIIIVIITLLIIPNFLLSKSLIESKKDSYSEIKEVGELMKANSNPEDIIMSTSVPQITYYSERSTYPYDILNYTLHQEGKEGVTYKDGEIGFNEFILDKKPRFLMVSSVFEDYPSWMLQTGTTKEGINVLLLPFFNSSIVYDPQTNQIISLDLKKEVKKENMSLKLFYPSNNGELNGIFIYEVEYS